jgi:hypothetical protein
MSIAESFGRSSFAKFVNSPAGRVLRIAVGIGLIAWGYTGRGSGTALALMVPCWAARSVARASASAPSRRRGALGQSRCRLRSGILVPEVGIEPTRGVSLSGF